MPGRVVLFVKFLLDVSGNVLFDVVFLEGLCCAIYSILLHLLRHVGILNDGLSVSHFGFYYSKILKLKHVCSSQ